MELGGDECGNLNFMNFRIDSFKTRKNSKFYEYLKFVKLEFSIYVPTLAEMNEAFIGAFRDPWKSGALGCSLVSLVLNLALFLSNMLISVANVYITNMYFTNVLLIKYYVYITVIFFSGKVPVMVHITWASTHTVCRCLYLSSTVSAWCNDWRIRMSVRRPSSCWKVENPVISSGIPRMSPMHHFDRFVSFQCL